LVRELRLKKTKKSMTSISYLLSITTSSQETEVILAILNTAGRGHALFGTSNEVVSKTLWFIPKGRKNKEEVTIQLKAIPAIQQVSVVALSQPLGSTELAEIRELFNDFNLDAKDVSDDELSLFIDSKIQGKYSYYIDFDHKNTRWEKAKIHIKRLEDHPQFSPDWVKRENSITESDMERDLSMDDIEVHTISFESSGEEEIEPPPPPPGWPNLPRLGN
jgi:hypothetical protein